MEINLQDIIKERIKKFEENPQKYLEVKGKEYNKEWAYGVKCFQDRINKDRKKEKKVDLGFLPIRQKLVALKEIDDLRWFYKQCLEYSYKKDKQGRRNSFSKCFFGSLKIK